MEDVKSQVIEVAQASIQKLGYNGFSYRDIATKVGIRSASIHYHFPTKENLGAAAAARYTERFMERLAIAAESETDIPKLLSFYVSLFRETLERDGRMCLCGMLGAEISSLPDLVVLEVRKFFAQNLAWLSSVFSGHPMVAKDGNPKQAEIEAASFMASLEGALILAKGLGEPDIFDKIAEAALQRYA